MTSNEEIQQEWKNNQVKNRISGDSRHQKLIELLEKEIDKQPAVLYCRNIKQDDGSENISVTFSDEVNVVSHRVLKKVRDLGYKLMSFGKNSTIYGNPTANFIEVDNQ